MLKSSTSERSEFRVRLRQDVLIGQFVWDIGDSHSHWHFVDFAEFSLRYMPSQNVVGATVNGTTKKNTFCLVDVYQHEPCGTLPNPSPAPEQFFDCYADENGMSQGISVGWVDRYWLDVDDQFIDVTNVLTGTYWLQAVVDPLRKIHQQQGSPNQSDTARVKVQIIQKDSFEPNNDIETVVAQSPLPPTSSNFGNCSGGTKVIFPLTIHQDWIGPPVYSAHPDSDYFRVYVTSTPSSGHFIKITFDQAWGDLDLHLQSESGGTPLASSITGSGSEVIQMAGRPIGSYMVLVVGHLKWSNNSTAINGDVFHEHHHYSLEVNLPPQKCGDVNGSGTVTNADVIQLGNYCTSGGTLTCLVNGDANGDCVVNCADRDWLIQYVNYGGLAPRCGCL